MSETDLLKQVLDEAKREVDGMEGWMKNQEPSPGVTFEDWILKTERTRRSADRVSACEREVALSF